jgi:PKD repeat protein
VRRGLVCVLALLILVPAASAAAPAVTIQANPTTGHAPLTVSFTATGDAGSYHWDFGDSVSAEGANVQHTYAAGRWTATLTARSSTGETATQTTVVPALRSHARRAGSGEVRAGGAPSSAERSYRLRATSLSNSPALGASSVPGEPQRTAPTRSSRVYDSRAPTSPRASGQPPRHSSFASRRSSSRVWLETGNMAAPTSLQRA